MKKTAEQNKRFRWKELLINNFGLKIVAAFIAFFIWFMVINGEDPIKTIYIDNVKVNIVNGESLLDTNQVYQVLDDLDGNETSVTTIRVTGRRSVVSRLRAEDFEARADLEELNAMNTVPIQVSLRSENRGISRENIACSPASLKVSIEDGIEQSFVVNVITKGYPESGYESSGTPQIEEGDSVLVWGAPEVIGRIGKVNLTVDITDWSTSKTITVPFEILDKNGDHLSESAMQNIRIKTTDGQVITEANVKVTLWAVENDIKLDLQTTGTPAAGYRVAGVKVVPETVNLAGASTTLEELGGVLTIEDAISVDGATENIKDSLDLSEFLGKELIMERDSSTTINYEVQIEKIGTTTIPYLVKDLTIEGRPEGMDVSLTPAEQFSIEVQAESEEMEVITADKIEAVLDLSKCDKEGTYTVPVEITLPDGYELVNEVTIAVNVKKAAANTTSGEE